MAFTPKKGLLLHMFVGLIGIGLRAAPVPTLCLQQVPVDFMFAGCPCVYAAYGALSLPQCAVPECVLLNEGLLVKESYGHIMLGKAEFSKVKV